MAVDGYVQPMTLIRREGFSRFLNEQPKPEELAPSFVRMALVATKDDLLEMSQKEDSEITEPLQNLIPVENGEWRYESHDIWRFWADPSWFAAQQLRQIDEAFAYDG